MHKLALRRRKRYQTLLLSILLLVVMLFINLPDPSTVHAASSYSVMLSTRNFGIQILRASAKDLEDPQHAIFSLGNGATLWYGIDVQSQPSGLRPVAADPLDDLVSSAFAQDGMLLPPADIVPLNNDGFFENVTLSAAFSGPGQQMQLTLNPFDISAATYDVLGLILELVGEASRNAQVGLLAPGHLEEIHAELEGATDLVDLVNDFVSLIHAAQQHAATLFGAAKTFVSHLVRLLLSKTERTIPGNILVLVVGSAIPGIAETLASYALGLKEFLVTAKLVKFLADLALSLGSYLFQQDALPTVTLQTVASGTPLPTVVPTPSPTPTPLGTVTEFPLLPNPIHKRRPIDITSGPDGNLWFIDRGNIGHITPGGVITVFSLPFGLTSITSGPDGNLWFTEFVIPANNKIGRITLNGTVTEFSLPANSFPGAITSGPDGNLWFTEVGKIGRITPDGTITEFSLPNNFLSVGIASGPDGNLWFTDLGPEIGRITPGGVVTEFPLPTVGTEPRGITSGPDGNLWFTENGRIGRITPGGVVTEFSLLSTPFGITSGLDGNLWFTELSENKIGRITPGGTITTFPLPTLMSEPFGITSGPDGNLWFTEYYSGKIGQITAE